MSDSYKYGPLLHFRLGFDELEEAIDNRYMNDTAFK